MRDGVCGNNEERRGEAGRVRAYDGQGRALVALSVRVKQTESVGFDSDSTPDRVEVTLASSGARFK
jgi:hypothetical protein